MDTSLSYMVRVLANKANVTFVLMIMAEIMRVSSKCVKSRRFFEGYNLLLQLWAIEHFYQNNIQSGTQNKIHTHSRIMMEFVAPEGTDEWYTFRRIFLLFMYNGSIHG